MPSMTQAAQPRHHVSLPAEYIVLSVDTHKDVHVAAVITMTGALLDARSIPTTREGYRQLPAWARAFGRLQRAGVECTGSYGAALARYLNSEGISVTEVDPPDKTTRWRHGETDAIDAAAAAQAVLTGRATATAKTSDGPVESIRMFKMAKTSAIKSCSQAINQFKAALVAADPALREALTGLSNPKLIRKCFALESADRTTPAAEARHTLRLLARRIQHLTEEINDLTARITAAITSRAPKLLDRYGVGPDTAALNPVEGIRSLLRRGPLANVAFTDAHQPTRTLRRGLRQIQYRPHLIDGCRSETGLTGNDQHPTTRPEPQ
ncbi:IS110 family transposase [Streptomyces sp. GS7]|uniref:IS110 family transposase n=1 Tax=Streptomyces sp. GS7 TaxID=2692234 RepID=UPI003FA6F6C0